MLKTSIVKNNNTVIYYIFIILLVISTLISDWVIGPISLSDIIIIMIMTILLISDTNLLKKINYKWYLFIMVLLLFHGIYHYFFNENFILKLFIYSFLKIIFYIFFINLVCLYVKENDTQHKTLIFLNIGAILAIIIGIYITVAIITNDKMSYEFLWTFTRTKHFSYVYKDFSNIIRTRSIFSEPAHLGYFLNMILGLNLFGRIKIPAIFSILLILGVGLTLSYASIVVTLILLTIKVIFCVKQKSFRSINMYYFLLLIPVVLIIIYFYEYIEITIINRTIEIFSGTDKSAFNRIFSSWSYINKDSLVFGNGIAHTPPIQNIYAYFLSDFGILGFILSLIVTIKLITVNSGLGIMFILLNFQKGGYLSPIFAILLVLLSIYASDNSRKYNYKKHKRKNNKTRLSFKD